MSNRSMDKSCKNETGEAFEIVGGNFDAKYVFLCDHASNRLPNGYGTLGLPKMQLERHIGYDIGAASVTKHLARLFAAPAILSRFSRLLIDPNRGADDPTLIMKLSDGAVVPGNASITNKEFEKRLSLYHGGYHRAVTETLDTALSANIIPCLVSIHSFTHIWAGKYRPWHISILWDKDDRLAKPLLQSFKTDSALVVGDNEPYTGRLKGDCMNTHGTMRALPHVLIEVRQDLIKSEEGQSEWAEILHTHLRTVMEDPEVQQEINKRTHYGSHSDES